jgi:S1-C subfamily serine protease/regulation of enolase protein 1 (concanavalin A-like superfamily)
MPIPFTCPNCQRSGRLPDSFTGDRIKCPACKTVTLITGYDVVPDEAPVPKPKPEPRPTPAPEHEQTTAHPAMSLDSQRTLVAWGGGAAALLVLGGVGFLLTRGGGEDKPAPEKLVAAAPSPAPAELKPAPVKPAEPAEPAPPGKAAEDPDGPDSKAADVKAGPKSAETVKRIKDATVYLKVRAGGVQGTGSGFVFKVEGDTILVATNHHVVNPHIDPDRPATKKATAIRPVVTAVFRSGGGTGQEQSVPATVVASDRVGNRDLAILRVTGVKDPPQPIALSEKSELSETMPVLIYGFPFGNINQMLNQSAKGNPAITINKGSVSSIRKDDSGKVSYVQIDGSLNPGNSGGPVVDEQGRLVGVAVAGISNTTIGFAIPPEELTRMLDGRVGGLSLSFKKETGGTADIEARATLIDPLNKIRSVEVLFIPAPEGKPAFKRGPDGSWPPLEGATRVSLSQNQNGAVATGSFQADVASLSGRRLFVQTSYEDGTGKVVYTNPSTYVIPNKPTAMASVGDAEEKPARGRALPLSFTRLGPLVDIAKNCKLEREDASFSIDVPAGVHLLSDELDIKNSPMTLTEIEGDFVAQVKVSGNLLPGIDPAKAKGKTLPFTYQGAGLVLWQDRNNYVRLERSAKATKGRGNAISSLSSEVLVEVCKNSKPAGRFNAKLPTDGPLYVRIARLNGAVLCMFSPDGKRWLSLNKLPIPFADKIQVGLLASNASKEALSSRFEEFFLITEKEAIEEANKP